MKKTKFNVSLALCLAAMLVISACGKTGSDSASPNSGDTTNESEGKDQLVVVSWGGAGTEAQRAAWYEPFEQETGIEIVEVTPPATSQLKAQVDSGNVEWDVVLMDKTQIGSLTKDGDYLDEIPYEEMDQELLSGIPEEAKRDFGYGAYFWGWALTYRTDVFDKEPQGWVDFWDTDRFPGPRTMPDQPHSTLEVALLANGLDPEDLYPVDEETALAKISELKSNISSFWQAGAEGVQMLADKEAVMGQVFSVQAASLIQDGVPVEIQWNQGLYAMDYWVVPKGQMSKEVIQFLEFISQPERQAALSNELPYGPVHEDALEFVNEDVKDNVVTNPKNIEKMVPYDHADWWGAHRDELSQRWQEWKLE